MTESGTCGALFADTPGTDLMRTTGVLAFATVIPIRGDICAFSVIAIAIPAGGLPATLAGSTVSPETVLSCRAGIPARAAVPGIAIGSYTGIITISQARVKTAKSRTVPFDQGAPAGQIFPVPPQLAGSDVKSLHRPPTHRSPDLHHAPGPSPCRFSEPDRISLWLQDTRPL